MDTLSAIDWNAHALYGLAWVGFGAVHSLLAAKAPAAWLERRTGRFHRLLYNAIAQLTLGVVAFTGFRTLGAAPGFGLPGTVFAVMIAVEIAGWVLLALALRAYDGRRLLGLSQLREAGEADGETAEPLQTQGLNAHVRHPLYAAGFVILWARARDPLGLATALWASAYLLVGARFEERKLVALYGTAYSDYRSRVPAFVPNPARWFGKPR